MNEILMLSSSLFILALMVLFGYQQQKLIALERRVSWLERTVLDVATRGKR